MTSSPPSNDTAAGIEVRTGLDLVADRESAVPTLEAALVASGALDGAPSGDEPPIDPVHLRAAKHMRKQIAEHVAGILVQLPITDMLVGGWKHLDKVEQARLATTKDGSTVTVAAGHHEVTVRHDPHVDLVVDQVPVPVLKLLFDVVFAIGPSVFDITAGEIVRTTPGLISATAKLVSNKVTIIERATPQIDPRGLWPGEFEGPFVVARDPAAEPDPAAPRPTTSQINY